MSNDIVWDYGKDTSAAGLVRVLCQRVPLTPDTVGKALPRVRSQRDLHESLRSESDAGYQ